MKILKTVISSVLSMGALLLMQGCVQDNPSAPQPGTGSYGTLVLSVDLGSPSDGTTTRSPFDNFDNEDDKWGKDGENMESLRILIVDGTGAVEANRFINLTNATTAGEYEFRIYKNDTKRIFLVANEGYYSLDEPGMEIAGGTTSLSQLLESLPTGSRIDNVDLDHLTLALEHNSPDGKGESLKTPLPISAVYTEEIGEDATEIRRVYDLHRAAVKYSFRIVNLSPYPHRLQKLRIDRIADREYLFPDADWGTNSLGHTVLTDYRTPQTAQEGYYEYVFPNPLDLPQAMTEAVAAMPAVYVPEGLKGDEPQKVSLMLDDADLDVWRDLEWRMPGETETTARPMTDLPRNTHVVVNITIREDNDITMIADIQPYSSVVLDPYFGFDRDENGNIILERREDGTLIVLINKNEVRVDAHGDRIMKDFDDGSVLCQEVVYKDYIQDSWEVDYTYIFEKDAPGGNMVLCRQKSGAKFHADKDIDGAGHVHGPDDRPLFILDSKGDFHYVTYGADGKPIHSRKDMHNDEIIQVNGYQFRNELDEEGKEIADYMTKYIGTYLVKLADGNTELRNCLTGEKSSLDNPAETKP